MRAQPFFEIDSALEAWAAEQGLDLQTEYKDDTVRSFTVAHPRATFQLWVEPPRSDGSVSVAACDHAGPPRLWARREVRVPASAVTGALDDLLLWIKTHA